MTETEELKKMVEENLAISKESLNILKKMHRAQMIASAFKVFYWLLIIGAFVGAYYYIKPILETMMVTWQKVASDVAGIGELGKNIDPDAVSPDLMDRLKGLLK
jgi:amino acid permease